MIFPLHYTSIRFPLNLKSKTAPEIHYGFRKDIYCDFYKNIKLVAQIFIHSS